MVNVLALMLLSKCTRALMYEAQERAKREGWEWHRRMMLQAKCSKVPSLIVSLSCKYTRAYTRALTWRFLLVGYIHVCMYTCIYGDIDIWIHVCIYAYIHGEYTRAYTRALTWRFLLVVYIHVCMCTYIYGDILYTDTCMYIYICMESILGP
jgi:hypothetical protein